MPVLQANPKTTGGGLGVEATQRDLDICSNHAAMVLVTQLQQQIPAAMYLLAKNESLYLGFKP